MALSVTAHFSLAPFASISDNPALSKNGRIRPAYPDGSRSLKQVETGAEQTFGTGNNSRSLKKDDPGPLSTAF